MKNAPLPQPTSEQANSNSNPNNFELELLQFVPIAGINLITAYTLYSK